jgi:hypothetical protein
LDKEQQNEEKGEGDEGVEEVLFLLLLGKQKQTAQNGNSGEETFNPWESRVITYLVAVEG